MSKNFYSYIRVSTQKQGVKGVSLEEQKYANEECAKRNNGTITKWFEERKTAAKRGRSIFNQMLKELHQRKADGVIIHKVDRSARNLKDWADLKELSNNGVEVLFANESFDMTSRSGKLTSNVLAVIAEDYISNLREETLKGMYGRLRQGLLPRPAYTGYLNAGRGKRKEIDPTTAPLLKNAFELYSTGRYTILQLIDETYKLGLRNQPGNRFTIEAMSAILQNPFYYGLIRVKRTGEMFPGIHDPLISKALFDRVQEVLHGRLNYRPPKHYFLFRRLIRCKSCNYSIIGERQKGKVYYRCQNPSCPTACHRQERIEEEVERTLDPVQFPKDKRYAAAAFEKFQKEWGHKQKELVAAVEGRLSQNRERMSRLSDVLLDRSIELMLFNEKKSAILNERKELEEALGKLKSRHLPEEVEQFLELAEDAWLLYKSCSVDEKRDLLKVITSNRWVDGKRLELVRAPPFEILAKRFENQSGCPSPDYARIWHDLIPELVRLIALHPITIPESLKDHLKNRRSA